MSSVPPPSSWRTLLIPACVLTVLIGLAVIARMGGFGDIEALADLPGRYAASVWAIPILIAAYCIGAYIGIPQFALHAGAVLAFGPWLGFGYGLLATLISGSLTFWTGRWGGEEAFRRLAGARATRISRFIGKNAFIASALVRNVPAGPFIFVNMAFGVSHARFLPFLFGMALGSLPKIGIVAFAGQSVVAAFAGSPVLSVAAAALTLLLWVCIGVVLKRHTAQNR